MSSGHETRTSRSLTVSLGICDIANIDFKKTNYHIEELHNFAKYNLEMIKSWTLIWPRHVERMREKGSAYIGGKARRKDTTGKTKP
jgi:hypothetical protein